MNNSKKAAIATAHNPPAKILVDIDALRRVLAALLGPPHLIRELQFTRGTPIGILIEQYNQHIAEQRDQKIEKELDHAAIESDGE